MSAELTASSWRRYLKIRVRGLIILVLVTAAWLGAAVRSAHVQRDAVAAVEFNVGTALYDWEFNDDKDIPGGKPWAPSWLVDLIGVDYFGHVTSVSLNEKPDEAAIAHAGRLTRLQLLDLGGSSVGDVELAHLGGLTNLSQLDLMGTQVTDAGLAHLTRQTKLSSLRLGWTRISNAGLAHLKELTNLSQLDLRETQVTDAEINDLKKPLPGLRIER